MRILLLLALSHCFEISIKTAAAVNDCPITAMEGKQYTLDLTVDLSLSYTTNIITWHYNTYYVCSCYLSTLKCLTEIKLRQNYSCSIEFTSWKYRLRVTIYSASRRNDAVEWTWTYGTQSESCHLRVGYYPTPAIKNCTPQGYIDPKTSVTCQCYLSDPGYLLNSTVTSLWVYNHTSLSGQILNNDGVSTATLEYKSYDPTATYYCTAWLSVGRYADTIDSYQPLFAYGPTKVDIATNSNSDSPSIRNCDDSQQKIKFYCFVRFNNVFKEPIMSLEGPDQLVITEDGVTTQGDSYRHDFIVKAVEGGTYTLRCVAKNTLFPTILTYSVERGLTVQMPPSSPPTLVIGGAVQKNTSLYTVNDGQQVTINCNIRGGYPAVNLVTINCNNYKTINSMTANATMTLNVTKYLNLKQCICSGSHPTGCYNLKTQVTLKVTYSPNITLFTVNSKQSETLEVEEGENVTFACTAEGNPLPDLAVRSVRSMNSFALKPWSVGSNLLIQGRMVKQMMCEDTDTYMCLAMSDCGVSKERNVSIMVKCSPRLLRLYDHRGQNTNVFKFQTGNALEIDIPIRGYPQPDEFVLMKTRETTSSRQGAENNDKNTTATSVVYNVTYTRMSPTSGNVSLRMIKLDAIDKGQYVLYVGNGVGKRLIYVYDVIITSKHQDDASSTQVVAGGVAGGIAVLIIVFVVIVVVCYKRKGVRVCREWHTYQDKDEDIVNTKSRNEQHLETEYDQDLIVIENDVYGMDSAPVDNPNELMKNSTDPILTTDEYSSYNGNGPYNEIIQEESLTYNNVGNDTSDSLPSASTAANSRQQQYEGGDEVLDQSLEDDGSDMDNVYMNNASYQNYSSEDKPKKVHVECSNV